MQEFEESTRTAAEAAAAVGCTVAQIAKSIVFRGETSGRAVLVVTSGTNRVDEAKVGALIGERIGRADAAFVKDQTGFSIGGVPPVGQQAPLIIVLDQDLATWPEIWAAGGTPNAVFRLTFQDLKRLTQGIEADVASAG